MAIGEINIIPIGTKSPSLSRFIAKALKVLESSGLKFEITSMGTIVEGELEQIFDIAGKMHNALFQEGVLRVVTTVKVDERRDKSLTMEEKVVSVRERLNAKI